MTNLVNFPYFLPTRCPYLY